MKKIAYIDHSFHKKTQSTDFFRDILRKEFILEDFWDDSWKGGRAVTATEINEFNPDVVIYFQSIGKVSEIKKIKSKNIIWVPMEDGYFRKKIEWLNYKKLNLKILCFSKAVFQKASNLGFDALYVQYFIEPKNEPKDLSVLRVYFWQRSKNIVWDTVKKLIGNQNVNKLIFRNIPDPFMLGTPVPLEDDIKKYNIEILDKWMEKKEMEKILSDSNVFIAPRKYEGIGMAFLEAMAYGMAVIAPNTSTHNEYIKSGFNGYLYDLNDPKPIDFSDLKDISANALKTVSDGYKKWVESKDEIVNFINKESKTEPLDFREKSLLLIENIFYLPLIYAKRTVKKMIKKLLGNFKIK